MHELSLTQSIVSIVSEHAGERKVLRVLLEVGKLSAIEPEAIRFCFDVVSRGTLLEGATLEILEIPGIGQCKECGAELELESLFTPCPCGSHQLTRRRGQDLLIKQIEVETG